MNETIGCHSDTYEPADMFDHAMHGLCIGCHDEIDKKDGKKPHHAKCATCHKPEIAPIERQPPSMRNLTDTKPSGG